MKKKLTSVLLAIAMLLTFIPISAVSVSAATSGTTGECTWRLEGTHLTISGEGAMENYVLYRDVVPAPWGTEVTKVTIENGVTTIGDWAFSKCEDLTSIAIPDSVTSIGEYAFTSCSGLSKITIPNSVTSIGFGAFYYCTDLVAITIPRSVTNIGDFAFDSCSSLASINVAKDNACYSSANGVLFNKSKTTLLFCPSVKSGKYTIPDTVTHIGKNAFSESNLTEIVVPKSVKHIEEATFHACEKLKKITLPFIGVYANEENAEFGSVFGSNIFINAIPSTLKTVVITGGTTIPDYAFSDCTELTSITLPDSVTSIGDRAFSGCQKLTKITLSKKLKTLGEGAFYDCNQLTSITIPDSVTAIEGEAFYGCSKLAEIVYSKNLKTIGYNAFYDCAFTSITVPDSVTTIDTGAFAQCKKLKTITLGKSVKTLYNYVNIATDCLFGGCDRLTSIKVSSKNSYFSSVNGVLFNKKKTKLILFPAGKSGAYTTPKGTATIASLAFYDCNKLTSLTLSDSVKTVEKYAISDCEKLKKLSIGKGVKTFSTDFDYYNHSFSDCPKLTTLTVSKSNPYFSSSNNVLFNKKKTTLVLCAPGKTGSYTIPDSVTKINRDALGYKLNSIVIPTSIKTIEEYYIAANESTRVYYTGTLSQAKKIKFDGKAIGYDEDPAAAKQLELSMWHYNTCKTHKYTNSCDKTCNKCDWVRTIKHKYTNSCDTKCNICKAKRTIKHTYKVAATKKASLTVNGKGKQVCSECGYTSSKVTTIYKASKVSLSTTSYTYTGSVKKPSVTVKDSKGKTISSKYYTVTYASGRKNVGTYKVTVKMKGNYSGTKTLTFKIIPPKTTLGTLTAAKKALTVKWTKKSTQVTGYQIQYSTTKSFKSYKTKTVSSYKTTSTTLSGLSAKKTYYVRVRTYKTVNGTKYYSGWSTIKYKKTK